MDETCLWLLNYTFEPERDAIEQLRKLFSEIHYIISITVHILMIYNKINDDPIKLFHNVVLHTKFENEYMLKRYKFVIAVQNAKHVLHYLIMNTFQNQRIFIFFITLISTGMHPWNRISIHIPIYSYHIIL